jgi:hypothetical protein
VTTPSPRRNAKRPLIVWDAVITSILLGLLGVLTFAVSVFGALLAMASDPCGGSVSCNSELIGLGVLVAMALPWLLLTATVVVAIVFLVKRWIAFWVPLAGAPLVVASWFIGALIADAGVPG